MVAHLLPKQRVAGSNPVSRSIIPFVYIKLTTFTLTYASTTNIPIPSEPLIFVYLLNIFDRSLYAIPP